MQPKTLQQLVDKTFERMSTFRIEGVIPALRAVNEGAMEDVLNTNGCAYYQFSTCLVEVMRPQQVVELGGAMGVWDLMVLHSLTPEAQLHSITLEEHGLEYCYVVDKYPNFHPVIGNDLDLNNWNNVELGKTDLWFMDTFHQKEQLEKELELYKPYFKKGAIIMFDDIHINEGMEKVWDELPYEKLDMTDPLHYSGFGICKI